MRQKVSFGGQLKLHFSVPAFFLKSVGLNSEARAKNLTIQPSLATASILATRAGPIYLAEEFSRLLPVLLKENKDAAGMHGPISFVSGINQGNAKVWGESNFFLCNTKPRVGSCFLDVPQVGWCSLVYVED